MSKTRIVTMFIHTCTDKAFVCSVVGDDRVFYMPRAYVRPMANERPRFNREARFEIPEWLALSHRQICGDDAFEANKARKKQIEKRGAV